MDFCQANRADLDPVMEIIRQAQAYFKENGIDQWQNGYPNEEIILSDMERGNSYVMRKNGRVIATAAVSFDGESTYDTIYEGAWLTGGEYAVIHRIAVDGGEKGTGVAAEIIGNTEMLCSARNVPGIRVDTHEKNRSMQRMLEKNHFRYCGIIYLHDGSLRMAFEKIL